MITVKVTQIPHLVQWVNINNTPRNIQGLTLVKTGEVHLGDILEVDDNPLVVFNDAIVDNWLWYRVRNITRNCEGWLTNQGGLLKWSRVEPEQIVIPPLRNDELNGSTNFDEVETVESGATPVYGGDEVNHPNLPSYNPFTPEIMIKNMPKDMRISMAKMFRYYGQNWIDLAAKLEQES